MTGPTHSPLASGLLKLGDWASWTFFLVFAIGTVEVGLRYLLNSPTSWAHVTSTALAVAGFAVGGAYAMVQDQHMRVTVLVDRANPTWQRAASWLALACGAVYLLGLGWGLYREAATALWRFDGGQWNPEKTPGPPNWPLPAFAKAVLLLGALLFLLAVLEKAARLLKRPSAES